MTTLSFTRRTVISLPFASLALAGRWEEAHFPDWSESFIDKLLTDSPWAKPWRGTGIQSIGDQQRLTSSFSQIGGIGLPSPIPGVGWPRSPGPGGSPRSGGSAPAVRIGVDLIIRWASALPVRRALALQEFGRAGLDNPRAVEMLSTKPSHYVIELAGIPRVLINDEFKRGLQRARLILPGRRPLSPEPLEEPSVGASVTTTLRFPRTVELDTDDGKAELLVQAGSLGIEEKFKLRSMTYQGRLEL